MKDAINERAMQATDGDTTGQTGQTGKTRYASVPRNVVDRALQQATEAANELHRKIEEAKQRRDALARQIGAEQEIIDRMQMRHNDLTRHVRNISAACDQSTP